jgi:hypothetical protein
MQIRCNNVEAQFYSACSPARVTNRTFRRLLQWTAAYDRGAVATEPEAGYRRGVRSEGSRDRCRGRCHCRCDLGLMRSGIIDRGSREKRPSTGLLIFRDVRLQWSRASPGLQQRLAGRLQGERGDSAHSSSSSGRIVPLLRPMATRVATVGAWRVALTRSLWRLSACADAHNSDHRRLPCFHAVPRWLSELRRR